MQLSNYFKNKQERIESLLEKHLPESNSRLVNAIRYSTLSGGKRLRPLLVYATGEGLSVPLPVLDSLACSVEFMHCYSLIHDDLPAMDNDDLRRGKPTCHIAFDEATAILAGDALQTLAFEILTTHPPDYSPAKRVAFIKTLAKACGLHGMAEGQTRDIFLTQQSPSLEELREMHQLKTGCLLQACIQLPIIAADFSDTTALKHLYDFSTCLGLAFQIKDDILDIEAPTDLLGKRQGADIQQNKATYPRTITIVQAKNTLEQLLSSASEHLSYFGDSLNHLQEMMNYVVHREY